MTKGLLVFTVLSLLIFSGCFGSSGHSGIIAINASSPGSEVDLEKYIYPGKITIVDFYADWCGPCRQIGPYLEKLHNEREDIIVRKVNIDKWGSPVCKQFNINSVPSFLIYNEKGRTCI